MKKLRAIFLLVLIALAVLAIKAQATNDTCVNHKGREIWIDHNALDAHLAHGDSLCNPNHPSPVNPIVTETPENSHGEQWLPIILATCTDNGHYVGICQP